MGRSILSVIAGLVSAVIVIHLVQLIGHSIYPPPSNLDFNNKEQIEEMLKSLPAGALVMVVLGWVFGSFAGGIVVSVIAPKNPLKHSLVLGIILTVIGVVNLFLIPHPTLFWIFGIIVYIPFALLGSKFVSKSKNTSQA